MELFNILLVVIVYSAIAFNTFVIFWSGVNILTTVKSSAIGKNRQKLDSQIAFLEKMKRYAIVWPVLPILIYKHNADKK